VRKNKLVAGATRLEVRPAVGFLFALNFDQELTDQMCNNAVTEFRQSMQKAPGVINVSLDDSPTSPADVDGSLTAGAGEAAGEGSPGGSQAAGGSARGEGHQANDDFAREHHLPLKGILESSGRSSLSRGLIL
jgi:hypothetical protein